MEELHQDQNLNLKVTSSLSYKTSGDERLMTILYKKVEDMEQKIWDLETKKIIDETQLPIDMLENNGLFPIKPEKLKRGRGYRPILQAEIEEAKKHSPFARQQARWLGIHLHTYKKYANMYGIYEPKPNEKGKRSMYDPERGRFPLSKILTGEFKEHKSVSDWMVKDKLIRSGKFAPKCNICGYDKRRIIDNKIALLLDHKDGDNRNYNLDNLQLLCLNCTFECGRGYIRRGNHMFDPDWLQGARNDEIDPRARW